MMLRKKVFIFIGVIFLVLTVVLYASSRFILMDRFAKMQELIFALLAIGLVSGLVVMLLLEKYVLSRLSHLDKTAKDISLSDDFSALLPVAGGDELSNLTGVINGMLGALRKSHDDLEIRVQERTTELAKANEVLQIEITKRESTEEELKLSLEKLQKTIGEIINVVALTIEMRDPYTAGHQRRVANLARAIAQEMKLSENQIDGIYMAGIIHDMGKIAIPAEILSKPSKLGENESGIVKTHPQAAYQILKEIEFPWPIAQIVLQHHERMNGSGYPQGLSGEAILLGARVLAVADVVEAMSYHRPYRPAFGINKALEELSQNKGIFYDFDVVGACLNLFIKKEFKFE